MGVGLHKKIGGQRLCSSRGMCTDQGVCSGNFLLFRRLSYDKKIPCGGERECVQQWVGFEPWTSWIILRVQSGAGAGSMKSGSFPLAAAESVTALIEFALVWQDVRLGNFLLFLTYP